MLNKNKKIEYINQMPLKINKNLLENKINSNIYFELKDILTIEALTNEIDNSI